MSLDVNEGDVLIQVADLQYSFDSEIGDLYVVSKVVRDADGFSGTHLAWIVHMDGRRLGICAFSWLTERFQHHV